MKAFEDFVAAAEISRAYQEIRSRHGKGLDRLTRADYESRKEREFEVMHRRLLTGRYKFTPYLEVLKLKGRGKAPRVISIASIRDQVVLFILKEILHSAFPRRVNRELPNARIRRMKKLLEGELTSELVCIRTDIQNFYDSISQEILLEKLRAQFVDRRITDLIRRAIRTPTVPQNYSRSDKSDLRTNSRGVPQGLAISNILADVYMSSFDDIVSQNVLFYSRYVDDILLFVDPKDEHRILGEVDTSLSEMKLQRSVEKTSVCAVREGFEYLGYSFHPPVITVRKSSVDRFLRSLTKYSWMI